MNWKTFKLKLEQYRKSIVRSMKLLGLSVAAIIAVQLSVTPPPLPLASCGAIQWVTTQPYRTVIAGEVIEIPASFTNDLGSIPDFAQAALGISRDHPAIRRGALVHDYLYRTKRYTRETADWLLWQACLADGMEATKAEAVYQWVRCWGWKAWER
jgi:hypothetical protein